MHGPRPRPRAGTRQHSPGAAGPCLVPVQAVHLVRMLPPGTAAAAIDRQRQHHALRARVLAWFQCRLYTSCVCSWKLRSGLAAGGAATSHTCDDPGQDKVSKSAANKFWTTPDYFIHLGRVSFEQIDGGKGYGGWG